MLAKPAEKPRNIFNPAFEPHRVTTRISLCGRITIAIRSALGISTSDDSENVAIEIPTPTTTPTSTPSSSPARSIKQKKHSDSSSIGAYDTPEIQHQRESSSTGSDSADSKQSTEISEYIGTSEHILGNVLQQIKAFERLFSRYEQIEIEIIRRKHPGQKSLGRFSGIEMTELTPPRLDVSPNKGEVDEIKEESKSLDEEMGYRGVKRRLFDAGREDIKNLPLDQLLSLKANMVDRINNLHAAIREELDSIYKEHLLGIKISGCKLQGGKKLSKEIIDELALTSRRLVYKHEQMKLKREFRDRPSVLYALSLTYVNTVRLIGRLSLLFLTNWGGYTASNEFFNHFDSPEQAGYSRLMGYEYFGTTMGALFVLTYFSGLLELYKNNSVKIHAKASDFVGSSGFGLIVAAALTYLLPEAGWPYFIAIGTSLICGALAARFSNPGLTAIPRHYSEFVPYSVKLMQRLSSITDTANLWMELYFAYEQTLRLISYRDVYISPTQKLLLTAGLGVIGAVLGATRNRHPFAHHAASSIISAIHDSIYPAYIVSGAFELTSVPIPLVQIFAIIATIATLPLALYVLYKSGDTLAGTPATRPKDMEGGATSSFSGVVATPMRTSVCSISSQLSTREQIDTTHPHS